MLFLLIVVVLVWLLYKWLTSNHDHFANIGLPFEKPLPLVGNMLKIALEKESLLVYMQRNYNKYKSSR